MLAVIPSITIVFFKKLDAKIHYFNAFIILLYMFWTLLCSYSGGQIVLVQHLLSSLSLGDRSDHSLLQDSRNLCIEQSPKESGDTRCCTNTTVSWRWAQQFSKHVEEYNKCIKIKNLFIKLVKKTIIEMRVFIFYTRVVWNISHPNKNSTKHYLKCA